MRKKLNFKHAGGCDFLTDPVSFGELRHRLPRARPRPRPDDSDDDDEDDVVMMMMRLMRMMMMMMTYWVTVG